MQHIIAKIDEQLAYHKAMVETLTHIREQFEDLPLQPNPTPTTMIRDLVPVPVQEFAKTVSIAKPVRRKMTPAQKAAVSRRMKRYWASRRRSA